MLSSLRQTTRFLPRLVPHRACIQTITRSQEDEAVRVISELDNPVQEPANPSSEISSGGAGAQEVDLGAMHHFIPPAQSPMLHLFATMIMKDGKYATAANRISRMLLHIHAMTQSRPMPIVEQAVRLASPALKVTRKKMGARVILTPAPLTDRQRTRKGIKWLTEGANKPGRPGKNIEDRLAREILTTLRGEGYALQQKKELHELAMVNRSGIGRN